MSGLRLSFCAIVLCLFASGVQGESRDRDFHGPWLSQDEGSEFILLRRRMSWWTGERKCEAFGYELASWDVIKENWEYLKGTTRINPLISRQNGCRSLCTSYLWTADEKNDAYAYEFSNWNLDAPDYRGMIKSTRYSVLCVR